jgi:hypothetical protein
MSEGRQKEFVPGFAASYRKTISVRLQNIMDICRRISPLYASPAPVEGGGVCKGILFSISEIDPETNPAIRILGK